MPRQIFKNRIIATAGPLPDQLTIENIRRWTELRKGCFSEDFDETVTHLLCSREQFKKRVPRVRDALKRGKRFHIVHYDWFEFSTVSEKREPERKYSMRNLLAKENAKRRELARVEKGKRDGERFVNMNLFHIYTDREFFPYQIDITRDDEIAGEYGQRYTLCLWESDAKPHLYWFTAKFLKKKGDSQPSYHRPSPCSGKWRTEMDHFTEFFKIKTGIEWEDRVIKAKTMPSTFFQYSPPTGGRPAGRRLRFEYEYCRQINAELRGLPWPPPEPLPATEQHQLEGIMKLAESDGQSEVGEVHHGEVEEDIEDAEQDEEESETDAASSSSQDDNDECDDESLVEISNTTGIQPPGCAKGFEVSNDTDEEGELHQYTATTSNNHQEEEDSHKQNPEDASGANESEITETEGVKALPKRNVDVACLVEAY